MVFSGLRAWKRRICQGAARVPTRKDLNMAKMDPRYGQNRPETDRKWAIYGPFLGHFGAIRGHIWSIRGHIGPCPCSRRPLPRVLQLAGGPVN